MNKIELTKIVVSTVVGVGATRITKQIIANNTEQNTMTDKVTMTSGSVVAGAMAAKATGEYTDSLVDKLYEIWDEIKNPDKTE